jgi:hypothetical protein
LPFNFALKTRLNLGSNVVFIKWVFIQINIVKLYTKIIFIKKDAISYIDITRTDWWLVDEFPLGTALITGGGLL